MSLIITKNFKRAKALDAAAKDSIADKEREYTRLYELAQKNITFYAAKGDSAKVAEWKRKADEYKRLAQEATDAAKATDAKDSIATDAQFKVGDRVKVDAKYSSNVNGGVGIVSDIKNGDVVVEFTGHGKVRVPALYVQSADSSFAADANFKKGDKVTVKTKWAGTRKGIVKEVINDPALKKSYVVEIEGAETAAYPAEIVSADACDAAEFHVGQRVRAKDHRWAGYQGHAAIGVNE